MVSVVLNVYNEEKNIQKCLGKIRSQDYPQQNIEIILVDDNSEDKTVNLAKMFNVRVYKSGYRNRERAKSIGLSHVNGDYVLFMDADVFLQGNSWISKAVKFLEIYPSACAVQNVRWAYESDDFLANRYCNLFGVNDPLVFFLGKRGALMATENEWDRAGEIIKKNKDHWLVKFKVNNLPTMGAQGYMSRKELILKTTWKPYYFHMDAAYELVKMGYDEFVLAILPIEHKYVRGIIQFHKKLYRNIVLFMSLRKYRKYAYDISFISLLKSLFVMLTIVYPLCQSIKGYLKKRDTAWFLHPIFCFTVPIMYAFIVVKSKFNKT